MWVLEPAANAAWPRNVIPAFKYPSCRASERATHCVVRFPSYVLHHMVGNYRETDFNAERKNPPAGLKIEPAACEGNAGSVGILEGRSQSWTAVRWAAGEGVQGARGWSSWNKEWLRSENVDALASIWTHSSRDTGKKNFLQFPSASRTLHGLGQREGALRAEEVFEQAKSLCLKKHASLFYTLLRLV